MSCWRRRAASAFRRPPPGCCRCTPRCQPSSSAACSRCSQGPSGIRVPLTLQFPPLFTCRHSCKSGCLEPAPVLPWLSSPVELTQCKCHLANVSLPLLCSCRRRRCARWSWPPTSQVIFTLPLCCATVRPCSVLSSAGSSAHKRPAGLGSLACHMLLPCDIARPGCCKGQRCNCGWGECCQTGGQNSIDPCQLQRSA